MRIGISAFFAVLIVLSGIFFIRFAQTVASTTIPEDPKADAIVVLTGGTERVSQAVRLLGEGRAKRLLISGVHPGTKVTQIAAMTGSEMSLFDCCIDLDRLALNTEDNASETAAWVHRNDFSSLMIVTSAYHLPRASAELKETLDGVRLVPYPVYSRELDLAGWYRDPATIRLLIREYVKYTLASFRIIAKSAARSLGFQ
jgi:uncharacterized SAM-binding protein YcdF (DUF218 family)